MGHFFLSLRVNSSENKKLHPYKINHKSKIDQKVFNIFLFKNLISILKYKQIIVELKYSHKFFFVKFRKLNRQKHIKKEFGCSVIKQS